MRFSEAHHKQVVATSTATKAGRVEGFVIAPGPARITALRLGKVDGHGTLLSWSDLKAFGYDAVTIENPELIRRPHDATEERAASKDLEILGKPSLDEYGDGHGRIVDVDFDPATGEITAIITDREEVRGAALAGLGGYAAIFAGERRAG
jgi:uncharacterized protein YrrD